VAAPFIGLFPPAHSRCGHELHLDLQPDLKSFLLGSSLIPFGGRLSFASSVGRLHHEENNVGWLGRCCRAALSQAGSMIGPREK
jgi:hypothetical protein